MTHYDAYDFFAFDFLINTEGKRKELNDYLSAYSKVPGLIRPKWFNAGKAVKQHYLSFEVIGASSLELLTIETFIVDHSRSIKEISPYGMVFGVNLEREGGIAVDLSVSKDFRRVVVEGCNPRGLTKLHETTSIQRGLKFIQENSEKLSYATYHNESS